MSFELKEKRKLKEKSFELKKKELKEVLSFKFLVKKHKKELDKREKQYLAGNAREMILWLNIESEKVG